MCKYYTPKTLVILACLTMQTSLYPMAKEIAQAIINTSACKGIFYGASAIATASAAGGLLGFSAPKSIVGVESSLAGAVAAACAGALSACTLAPYAAYKGGKVYGLLAYGASMALLAYAHFNWEEERRKRFSTLDPSTGSGSSGCY